MVDMSRLAKSGMRRDVATRKIRKITIGVYSAVAIDVLKKFLTFFHVAKILPFL